MPSEAFMQSVLGTDTAAAARGEVVEEPVELPAEEEQPEDEQGTAEEAQPDEDEVEDEQPEESAEDDEGEADEEAQGEGAYASWDDEYPNPEAVYDALQMARKQERDNRAWGQEQSRARAALERDLQEARELLAYQSGRAERADDGRPSAASDEFREWVEEMVEAGQPERGLLEVRQYAEQTGDWTYAQKYTDIWAEDDPYRAGTERTFVEMARSLQQSRQGQEPEEEEYPGQAYDVQQSAAVIDQAREFLTQHYPDLQVGSPVLKGTVEVIKEDIRLHQMLRSGDFQEVTWAIEVARDRYLARQPRRARASRASRQAVDAEKTALPRGDGVRLNGRRHSVSDGVPPELEGMLNQFGNWGMLREE